MGWPSEYQREGLGRAPPDEGGELVDAAVERVTGAERRAPIGGLVCGGVDRAGGGGVQHSLHGRAVEDLDLVGFQFLAERHLEPAPAVGRERAGSAGPPDRGASGRVRAAASLLAIA